MRLLRGAAAVCALALLATVLHAQNNTIKSIQTVGSHVEITVKSGAEFDVRDEVVTLRIGSANFSNSKSPADGDTHLLIFVLSQAEWDALATGSAVTIGWGSDASSNPRNFGTLDKSQLNQ